MMVVTCLVVVATILLLVAYYLASFFIFYRKTKITRVEQKPDDKKTEIKASNEPMQIDADKEQANKEQVNVNKEQVDANKISDMQIDTHNEISEPNDNSSNNDEVESQPPPLVYLQRSRVNHDDADDKIIDMARARRSIPDVGIPTELTTYKIGGKTIGKYKNWATNHRRLIDITHTINDGLRHCHNHVTETLGVTVAEDFIVRLHQDPSEILKMPVNAILSTLTMLGHFLLLSTTITRLEMRDKAIGLIRHWVTSPRQLADKRRVSTPSDIVQLTGPWLLAHYHTLSYKEFQSLVLTSEDFLFAREVIHMRLKNQLGEQGRHWDGSYFDGNSMLSFDTLCRLANANLAYVFGLVVIDGNPAIYARPEKLWSRVNDIISHPVVHMGLLGVNVFQDPDSYTIQTNQHAPLGVRVIPLCKYLRCFTETHHFSVRGLSTRLPYFNKQTMPENSPQYIVQYRGVFTQTSSAPIVTFPNQGLVVKHGKDLEPIRLQWSEPSVVRYPHVARCVVFKYRQYGILYQTYKIPEFGDYRITELITVNTDLNLIEDLVLLENESPTMLYNYYSDSKLTWPTGPQKSSLFKTTMDISKADIVTTSTLGIAKPFPTFPISFHPHIELRLINDKYVVLYDENKARICCPFECETESEEIETADTKFNYDSEENQWLAI